MSSELEQCVHYVTKMPFILCRIDKFDQEDGPKTNDNHFQGPLFSNRPHQTSLSLKVSNPMSAFPEYTEILQPWNK